VSLAITALALGAIGTASGQTPDTGTTPEATSELDTTPSDASPTVEPTTAPPASEPGTEPTAEPPASAPAAGYGPGESSDNGTLLLAIAAVLGIAAVGFGAASFYRLRS
jgi:hypothetical protein